MADSLTSMDGQDSGAGFDLLKASEVQLDESRRSLDGQRNDLVSLRDRTGGLLGAAAVAASVAAAVGNGHRYPWMLGIAGAAFIVVAVCSLCVFWPRVFTFEVDTAAFTGAEDRFVDVTEMNRGLALSLTDFRASNAISIERMVNTYIVGLVALGIEVVALVTHSVGG